MLAQCARPLCALLCIDYLSPGFAMGSHALVPFPCTLHFWHLVGLAPHVVQDTAPGGLVQGAVIAALFHCHVVRRWFRHSYRQLLLICGHCTCIVCEVQQATPCMPHANSDFHAHACACTHGFAHPEHLHCCRFAVTYGLGRDHAVGPSLLANIIIGSARPGHSVHVVMCGCSALRTVTCTTDVNLPSINQALALALAAAAFAGRQGFG